MTTVLKIDGMTCDNCVRHVRDALLKVPGVAGAQVDLSAGLARVDGHGGDVQALLDAVKGAGYAAVAIPH